MSGLYFLRELVTREKTNRYDAGFVEIAGREIGDKADLFAEQERANPEKLSSLLGSNNNRRDVGTQRRKVKEEENNV